MAVASRFSAESVSTQLEHCTFCPKLCRHACPVSEANGREAHIPREKMARLGRLQKRQVPWKPEAAEALYACTGCRQCTRFCEHGNEPGLVLFAGRAAAVARGAGHPRLEGYPDRFRARDQRLVAEQRERFGTGGERTSPVGFFPGCDALGKAPDDVAAALDLFAEIGAESIELIDAQVACAGYPLLAAGYIEMFRWQANRVASELRGYRTVVVNCSACVYAMQVQYPAEGVTLNCEVISLAELLAQWSGQINPAGDKKPVYYHDPCYLARYVGVVEPPRRVLARVAELRELGWSGVETECCGGAGLLPKTMPAVADEMARSRLREISNAGGGTVVTSCGTCAFMLRSNAPSNVEVRDLATAVLERIGGKRERTGSP
jgi:Fe-S oxidoreductase